MGLRFRKSFRLFPGARVNLGLSGASVTLGGPGASVNVGRRGTRATVGIPGSGLSYSHRISRQPWGRRPARILLGSAGAGAAFLVAVAALGGLSAPPAPAPSATAVAPVALAADAAPAREVRTRTASNLRSGPSGDAPVDRVLAAGTRLVALSSQGPWTRVSVAGDGAVGWIHASLLD